MDNVIDRMVARRSATGLRNGNHTHPEKRRRGENHGMAKIIEEDVRQIRALHRIVDGYGFGSFWARKLSIPVGQVLRIVRGEAWASVSVPDDYQIAPKLILELADAVARQKDLRLNKWHKSRDGKPGGIPKLDADKVRQIRQKAEAEGVTYRQLGIEFGVSGKVISDVVNRKAWAFVS